MGSIPEPNPNLLMNDQQQQNSLLWLNQSPCFSNVDHLLSPGFSISENAFQSFFTNNGYDNNGGIVVEEAAYDHIVMPMPMPGGEVPIDLLY